MSTTREGSKMASEHPKLPYYMVLTHKVEDFFDEINWIHVAFKICAYTYISFIAWITWHILPISGHWDIGRQSDRVPIKYQDPANYFGAFNGVSECKISVLDLYSTPSSAEEGLHARNIFCPTRKFLLQAMSNGGRIGFDAPYIPQECHYRWYTIAEICMILERFDGLVFIGDATLQSIYNGLNILLRQDLKIGALRSWAMDPGLLAECGCDHQFTKQACAQYFVTSSSQLSEKRRSNSDPGNTYICGRPPHAFLHIDGSKPTQATTDAFDQLVPRAPRSNYKSIPIIHSLSPTTATKEAAAASLLHFLERADASERKTPMLWVGPTAAGHYEIKGRKGNQQIWDFDQGMAQTAEENDVEVLGMWNMTVQASSWDGMRFGEKVALTQAMMVVNWLGRLESS